MWSEEQITIAVEAVLLGRMVGARNAKRCAELMLGRDITNAEWDEMSPLWTAAWFKVQQRERSNRIARWLTAAVLLLALFGAFQLGRALI